MNIEPVKVIEGLNGWILCMNILNDFLYTGGDDRKIKVWDLKKGSNKKKKFKIGKNNNN